MPQKIYGRKPWHVKVKCPCCYAAVGSLCRSLVTSEMIAGTHYERTVDARQFEPSGSIIRAKREKTRVGRAPKDILHRLEYSFIYKAL
jgi:hypothetical protein